MSDYLRRSIFVLLIFALLFSSFGGSIFEVNAGAPVMIAFEDFDGGDINLSSTTNVFDFQGSTYIAGADGGSSGDVFGRVDGQLGGTGMPYDLSDDTVVDVSGARVGSAYPTDTLGLAGQHTTAFFGMNDMDGGGVNGNTFAQWTFDISSASSITDIEIDIAALGDFETSSSDGFKIEARIDVNAYQTIFEATTDESDYKTYRFMDNGTTAFADDDPLQLFVDGSGTPVGFLDKSDPTTGDFDTYTSVLLSGQSGSTLDIRVSWTGFPSGSEPMGVDNISIYGVGGAAVDIPPSVSNTTPTNSATDVALDANIDIDFSENVTVSGSWFTISCASSGTHTAVVSGGPQNFTLNPDTDFSPVEECTVTIVATQVADQDGTADNMAADYIFSFTTQSGTASVLTSLVFNEVLPDPNSSGTRNFDTDGDGTAETADEFLEIYNTSGSSLDISGLQFWDSGSGNYFTIPGGTTLDPNGFIVVVANIAGGSLPSVNAGSHAYSAGGALSLSNGGDNLVLYEPATDQFIQAIYNGDTIDTPAGGYAGFSTTATLSGSVQDFGSDTDGTSRALSPDGLTTNSVDHDTIAPGGTLATPGNSNIAPPVTVLTSLVFNEVLPDPNSSGTRNFDTDGDGTAETADEFLEIYNTSGSSLDISGLQFWDSGSGNYFTIPGGTTLDPNGFIVVVANIAGGSLPSVNAGSHAYSAGGALSLSNGGDNLVLYEPATDQFIQAIYNGDTIDTPAGGYAGFSTTATLSGSVQDFGSDTDGTSRALSPDGLTTNSVDHDTIAPGGTLATPGNSNIAPPVTVLTSLVFNEVLPDPNSSGTRNFDTDGDGTAETADEFLEIYNTSGSSLDISGLQFWDSGSGNYFTIPGGTTLDPNGFIVVVANIAGGSLPSVNAGSHAYSAGGALSLSNGGDNLVLYEPATDQFIQAIYNGDTIDTPAGGYAGFSTTATLSGSVQDFGSDTDGTSRALSPDGLTTNSVDHDTIAPGGTLATPGNSNIAPPVTVLTSLVFNEVLPDPNSSGTRNFDTDGDGTAETADEFLEIYNTSGSSLDISGLQFWDSGSGNYFTIPGGTTLDPNGFIVVVANIAGGSLPSVNAGSHAYSAGGALSLSNGGDNLVLYEPATDQFIQAIYNGDTIDTPAGGYAGFSTTATLSGSVQDFGSDTDGTSRALSPDGLTTNSVDHDTIAPGGTLATPGNSNIAPLVSECGNPATFIHTIQGSGAASGEDGIIHTIEGVVVGDFQTSSNLSGFFLQEEDADVDGNPMTSEGIFVYDDDSPAVDVNVGDVVRVTGTVDEYYNLTELTSVTSVEVCSSGATVTPASVVLPVSTLDVWEYSEGMLVNIPQTLYATDNYNLGRYGEVELSVGSRQDNPTNVVSPGVAAIALQELNDRSRIQLEDGRTSQNPVPAPYIGVGNTLRAGDALPSLTGVLHYAYGAYEIHPTETVTFTRVNFRSAAPDPVGGTLKVASFNVLNYFSTLDDSGAICGPTGGQDCRGADSAAEFTRQRDKIIAAIVAMDADVIGLIEIENHATDAALLNLVDGLNASAGAGTYTALITGPIGTDAIKVAFIYKSATVTPEGAYAVLDSSVDPTFNDDKNRPVLAQTFTQNSNGEIVTVAVNHLKSKGSNCDALGDPDTGDGQGNCNLTRTSAATALVNWLATDPTSSGDPDFLIMGDLNAYAMEDPIAAIVGAGYTDLTNSFTGSGAYSYVYYGQKGYLDYALGNPTLTSQVIGVTQWHINADEPSALDYNDYNQTALYSSNVYRSSDHDPVIVGLALGITPPTVLYEENTIPADGADLTTGPTQIFVEFDQAVKSGDADSADYLGNFLLVEAGINNVFDTLSCERGVATDDVQIVIDSVSYHDTSPFVSTLGINGNIRLPIGKYRLFVCGTTSIQNLDGLHLNGDLEIGFDSTLSFNVIPLTSAEELPDTGFQVGQVTTLPIQPLSKAYSGTDMTLSIPSIGVNMPIVGIPLSGDSWDVKWLGSNAGYLDGSAFPTWSGNTLITGHVWDSLDQPGPFFDVKTLGFGDQIKIEAWGQTYTYEVRESRLVTSRNVNLAMQSEEYDWVTLVTCEYFDAITGDYIYRRIVRAVLVDVR